MIDRLFNGTYSATKAMQVGICNKLVNLMKVSTQLPSRVIASHRPSGDPDVPKHKVPGSIKSRGFGKAPVKPHCGVLVDPQHCLNKQFSCNWLPCCGGCSLFTTEDCLLCRLPVQTSVQLKVLCWQPLWSWPLAGYLKPTSFLLDTYEQSTTTAAS